MAEPSPRGTYLQIAAALNRRISDGEFADALPSVMELADHYDVSRSTIERALISLKNEGVIESVKGAAWYVAGTGDRRPLATKLTEMLLADGFEVGDSFPTEAELCQRFGVSRTAVRSALAQLEGRGLLGKAPVRGREVRAVPTRKGAQSA